MDRLRLASAITLGVVIALGFGCSDNPTEPEDGDPGPFTVSEADSIATHWLDALSDSLDNLPDDLEDMQTVSYDEIRAGMMRATNASGDSRVAHLGLALLDIIEINYNSEMWAFIDSLISYGDDDDDPPPGGGGGGLYLHRGSPILRNQFAILATAPRELGRTLVSGIPDNLSVGEAQRLIEEVVLPAMDSAIDHMVAAEADGGPIIVLDVEDEQIEIDLGEILVFHAALHAARAGFRITTAYDFDLLDSGGGYGWIDDMNNLDICDDYGRVEEDHTPEGDRLVYVSSEEEDAAAESIGVAVLQFNLEQRADFLSQRNNRMADAYQDLLTTRDLLEDAVESIRDEGDPQEDDIIKFADLTDLDDEIASDPDKPNFAENFTTIEDVLTWIETVLTGTFHISEDGDNGLIEFDVRLRALFENAPANWKSRLPYHRFKPAADWVQREIRPGWGYDVSPLEEHCYGTCDDQFICRSGFVRIDWEDHDASVDPLELLDGDGGNPIDPDVEKVPYFPDYTFGGLFPGADRAMWLDVAEAAGW